MSQTKLTPDAESRINLSLVTRNEKDFAGTGVLMVNPWSV